MDKAALLALVLRTAAMYNVPPYLMVAIAEVESAWNPNAIHRNNNGTEDRGLMQLNSSWYTNPWWYIPECNVVAAAKHIVSLRDKGLSWYQVTIAYNCGFNRIMNPPNSSLDYAVEVYRVWSMYDSRFSLYVGR